MYFLPETITERLDKQRRIFFWQGGSTKRKYRLLKWAVICKSKKKGGLGIKDIRKMNISLLCKWWWKLENEDGMWQEVVRNKYMLGETVGTVKHMLDNSPTWTDLLKTKNIYLRGRKVETENGKMTLFWKDPWLWDEPICLTAPVLFDLCDEKDITVYHFLAKEGQIKFSRWLPPVLFDQWLTIVGGVFNLRYQNTKDSVKWKWGGGGGGKYKTKKVY
jgi:hypothetical protein